MNNPEQIPSPLPQFREEIRAYIESELRKKKEWEARGQTGDAYDPHVDSINPAHLTEADREFWERVKKGAVTKEWVVALQQKLREEEGSMDQDTRKSRSTFQAMTTNLASSIFAEQDLKELEREGGLKNSR